MRLQDAFKLAIYVLVATGLVALGHAEQNAIFLVGTLGGLGLAYWRAEVQGRLLGRLPTNLLIAACVLASPAEYLLFTGDMSLSLAHMLGAISVVKLLAVQRPRDSMQLIVISLIHLGLAAVLTVDLAFSLLFLVYMAVAVWTLLLFLLLREVDAHAPQDLESIRVGRGALGAFSAITMSTLVITAVLFVLFPRFSAVLFQIPRKRPANVSGFSERLGLADMSSIKLNEDDVMRVTVEVRGEGFPLAPLWRGLAYDRYDAQTREWMRRFERETREPLTEGGNRTWTLGTQPLAADDPVSAYTVLLAPTGTGVLFAVPEVVDLSFLSGVSAPTAVGQDAAGAIHADNMPDSDVRFRVRSRTPTRPPAVEITTPERRRYLAPPTREGAGRPLWARVDALSREILAAAGASEAPALDQVRALVRHLRAEPFEYAVDGLQSPADVDPVLHFLETTRRGHCELYASAFVLLARSAGIPARLVSGFQQGEWNEIGGYYRVRQLDAHAWAEVYADGRWVSVDPTPPADRATLGILARLGQVMDYVKLRWMNYVISYSLSDQLSAAQKVRQRLERVRDAAQDAGRWLRRQIARVQLQSVAIGIGAVAGVGLLVVALALWRRRTPRHRRRAADGAGLLALEPIEFYEQLLGRLARLGLERAPNETPRELASRAAARAGALHPALTEAPAIVDAYYAVRYGEVELSGDRLDRVRAALRRLDEPVETLEALPEPG